jgi:hypothetical protein
MPFHASTTIPIQTPMTNITYYDHILLRTLDRTEAPDTDEICIQIVPAYAADAAAGRISAEAPVGRAVLHRKLGDTVTVLAQGRRIVMKIVKVDKQDAA